MTVILLTALITCAAVAFVVLPFVRASHHLSADHVLPGLDLLEQRDHALTALKELEFDHRTGKLSDEDYRALVGPLRQEATAVLATLDRETV